MTAAGGCCSAGEGREGDCDSDCDSVSDANRADDDAADGEGATVRCVRRDHRNLKLGIHSMDFCPAFIVKFTINFYKSTPKTPDRHTYVCGYYWLGDPWDPLSHTRKQTES